jgi:chemotaxis protein methyltransferase WspC
VSLTGTVLGMLHQRIGLDPASIGPAMIERAVRGRAALRTGGNLESYLRELDGNQTEFQALVDAVVVPETWFFRYPESLAAMTDVALRRLAERPGAQLRILSLPCSTGEEPYSIAMALLSAGVAPARFIIDAVDISEGNIDAARHAVYGRNSFRGGDLAFRDRHFSLTEHGYALSPAVGAQVRLHLGNLLSPTLALPFATYDLVFCRNLLIYFDVATQMRSIQILTGLARQDGLLFVGPAEASVLTRMRHRSIGVPMAFAFHALPASTPAAIPHTEPGATTVPLQSGSMWRADTPRRTLPPRHPAPPWSASAPLTPSGAASYARTTGASAVLSAMTRDRSDATPSAMMSTAKATTTVAPPHTPALAAENASFVAMNALADKGHFEQALAACSVHLERFGPSASVFYRQGLFHDAARRPDAAQEAYRKTLYLEPHHPQALLQLAALLEAAGDAQGAARLRQRMSRREATQ